MSSTASKIASDLTPALSDDESDWRPVALTRMLLLGNPCLLYDAEDWNKIPTRHREHVERMSDQLKGVILDELIKKVRQRYRFLDELPTRYGIAFCAAYYLRRCVLKERHEICPEFYFYNYDDRLMFVDIFRGLRHFDEKAQTTESGAMERTASAKGFGRLIKRIILWCYDGRVPKRTYEDKRPYEREWRQVFEKRVSRRVMVDICANTCVHGWKHADIIKMLHLPSAQPWQHSGQLFTLVAWGGPRHALKVIDEEAPPEFGTRPPVKDLMKLLRAIDQIKHSDDPAIVAAALKENPDFCQQLFPPGIVPLRHYMNEDVASVFVAHSPLRQLFHFLPSWNARGYLGAGKPHLLAIVERLKKAEIISEERLSPAEVFMAWKNYERYEQQLQRKFGPSATSRMADLNINDGNRSASGAGGKRKRPGADPSAYEPSALVLDAFATSFSVSFQNFKPTDAWYGAKKFFIAVDVRPSLLQQPVYGAKYLKILEAVSCLLAVAVRKETSVQIEAFAASGLTPLDITTSMGVDEIAADLVKIPPGEVSLTAPLSKASRIGSNFFVVVTERPPEQIHWFKEIRAAAQQYEKEKHGSGVKIVLWFLNHRRDSVQPVPICDDVLVVTGWNHFVPEVIWSYARGQLDDVPPTPPQLNPQ